MTFRSTVDAIRAQAESGIIAAAQDYEVGGMQLPCAVQMAYTATFAKASLPISAYVGLTRGNASLPMLHGGPKAGTWGSTGASKLSRQPRVAFFTR